MPTGRPTDYSLEICQKICSRIAQGESVRSVVKDEDMPCLSTVFNWLDKREEFLEQYTRAKQLSAEAHADKINFVADETLAGKYKPDAAKVALDAYKWTASKLQPKKYGELKQISGTLNVRDASNLSDSELEAIAAGGSEGATEQEKSEEESS